ncbi:serine hydrolase [Streptomyces sp. NPDC018693]|uniref:serine hydrolase n=1 Tax=unclassified Streptomyces TaxID=2593676 RepID=UPI00379902F6
MESSRGRRRALLRTALAVVVAAGAAGTGAVYVNARAHSEPGVSAVSSVSVPASGEPGEASVEPVVEPEAVDHDGLLAAAMESVAVPEGAAVSVAVLDPESGESAVYGEGTFDTASIVKVDILAALLLRAQDDGRQLTAREKAYATAMIGSSDNDSATALWNAIGRAEGLDAANERFGLSGTSGGQGALWGLTQTTARDQLALLRQVFGEESELSEASRAYVQGLMEQIAVGQRWGVSAVADGSAWALKNGWLPRSTTGLWDVNSIGRVTVGGHDYLVAALSNGTTTQATGIALVEAAARAAVSVFTGDPSPSPDASPAASASVPG